MDWLTSLFGGGGLSGVTAAPNLGLGNLGTLGTSMDGMNTALNVAMPQGMDIQKMLAGMKGMQGGQQRAPMPFMAPPPVHLQPGNAQFALPYQSQGLLGGVNYGAA